MATSNLLRCDGCGKIVARSPADVADDRNGVVMMPDGWLHVAIWVERTPMTGEDAGAATKNGQFHSRSCAAAWVGKRVRTPRVKAPVNQGGQA